VLICARRDSAALRGGEPRPSSVTAILVEEHGLRLGP
jgi:hypothetical protein